MLSKPLSRKPSIADLDYSQEGQLKVLIDWCTFVVPYHVSLDYLFYEILGIPSPEFALLRDSRMNGYSEVYSSKWIKVMTKGRSSRYSDEVNISMGHCVSMSGQACREWEHYNRDRWREMLEMVFAVGGHVTRLDYAIDDFKGYFKVRTLYNKVRRDECVSRFNTAKSFESITINGGESLGLGLYFGSSSSDIRVNVYEKNFQQKVEKMYPIWNRTELRTYKDVANEYAKQFVSTKNVGQFVGKILNNYIRFVDKSKTDSNKRRWKTSKFWDDFIGHSETLKLSLKKPDRTVESISDYLYDYCSRNLALFSVLKPEEIPKLINEGIKKLDSYDDSLIRQFGMTKEDNERTLLDIREDIKMRLLGLRKESLYTDEFKNMAWLKYKKNVPIGQIDTK